jgi:predicted nucleic acid-binding protein
VKAAVLLDAGPLVAYLDPGERYHEWACVRLREFDAPLLTCEAVISEACFLLRATRVLPYTPVEVVDSGLIRVSFRLQEEASAVGRLMRRYANVPMSFADACLVRMAEQYQNSRVLTIDRHFTIYRKHGREVIPTIMPPL